MSDFNIQFEEQDQSITLEFEQIGGGAVKSVNGKTGVVVLDADDVGAYTKPTGGIPKTDLASAVQTSLGKADSAYQKPSGGIPASDIASGVIPTVDSTLAISGAAADAKKTGDEISDLKDGLNGILNDQFVSAYEGNVTGIRQVNVTGLSIPAGTYTFYCANISSTDTNDNTCRVIFVKNNTTAANIYANRVSNYTTSVVLPDGADEIRFFAANSYNNAAGDTLTFTGVKIYQDSELNKRFKNLETYGLLFKGRSNSVGLTDANNAGKNTIYNTAGTVVMANLPYSANEGVLVTTGGDYPVQLYFVNDGFYKRYYRGSANGWSVWVNTGVEIETTPSNLIANIKAYNGTGVTLRLSNETYDIISIYKAYYGNDWFDNYTGWNGNPDPFTRGLYVTGIKLKGRANTKFVMSADTGNTAVKTHFSIFAPYTDVTLEDFTIDIGNGFCRYCIHDDFAPQNCRMLYKNLVMIGSSYNANALYGMGCGSNVIYEFDKCWMMSGTSRAWYGHSAPNQTKPCIVKISNCVSYQNIGFKWYSNYSGMNIGYVDKSVQDVTCDAYYDAQTVNFNVYHDTGSTIKILPEV